MKSEIITETWERDDGWKILIRHDGEHVVFMDHLPQISTEPTDPMTWEYAQRAMHAHGYVPQS